MSYCLCASSYGVVAVVTIVAARITAVGGIRRSSRLHTPLSSSGVAATLVVVTRVEAVVAVATLIVVADDSWSLLLHS